jgi:hypothetical protein
MTRLLLIPILIVGGTISAIYYFLLSCIGGISIWSIVVIVTLLTLGWACIQKLWLKGEDAAWNALDIEDEKESLKRSMRVAKSFLIPSF